MQALVLRGPYDIEVSEIDEPTAGPGEVVIDILATGICGSDFHGYSGENGRRHPGQVMGHETVGHIAELGTGVTGLAKGQLVTINPVLSCDECDICRAGQEQNCPQRKVVGVAPEIVSTFADRFVIRASNVVPLADDLDPELGALVEPLSVGYHAARVGGAGESDRVLVIGGGPIGQACVLAAQRLGAIQVAVSDPVESRRALCAGLGATVLDPTAGDLAVATEQALGGKATLVIDAVGVNATVADALAASGLGARIVLVGMGSPELTLSAYEISTAERQLLGSFTYTRQDFADTAAWVSTNPPGLERLIDGRVGWDGAAQSFDELARGTSTASKILVFPRGVAAR
ncbi:zinc-dependent alcohol dehydrogenase [Propionibacteriaceae bacterium Y1685]|uniref:zinc-dependent alcohol dehydrogenase n=1 Tax=Microlunatus sp. Y1700 TaxID=3418487 RepID=UPI003B7744F8